MSNPDDSKKDENDKVASTETVSEDNLSTKVSDEEKDQAKGDEKDVGDAPEKSDDFFEDPDNIKKKSSPLIPFILVLFLCAAFLVFGYIYNIAGLRDKAKEYNFDYVPENFNVATNLIGESFENVATMITDDKSNMNTSNIVSSENAEADTPTSEGVQEQAVQAQEGDAETLIAEIDDSRDKEIEENPSVETVAEKRATGVLAAVQDIISPSQEPEAVQVTEKIITEYVPAYALLKDDFIAHKDKIRALNKEIYSGKSYINQLVAVKGLFPELELATMTAYSSVGKPKKFAIAQDGIDAVKRAAVMQELKTDAGIKDFADAFIRKFVVITPTENINEADLDGQLSLIKDAFTNGDFKSAIKYIQLLPEDRKSEFNKVVKTINDLYALKAEMRQIDDALTTKLYDNKKN